MREEDDIVVTDELVEVDLALGGDGREVGGGRSQTEAAGWLAVSTIDKMRGGGRAGLRSAAFSHYVLQMEIEEDDGADDGVEDDDEQQQQKKKKTMRGRRCRLKPARSI